MRFRILLLGLWLFYAPRTPAQEIIPKAGVAFSTVSANDTLQTVSSGSGLTFGMDYKQNFTSRLAVKVGLYFVQRSFKTQSSYYFASYSYLSYHNQTFTMPAATVKNTSNEKATYLEIPFTVDFYVVGGTSKRSSIVITLGGYYGYFVQGNYTRTITGSNYGNSSDDFNIGREARPDDAGALIGTGFIFSRFRVDGSYAKGLKDPLQRSGFQVTLGIPIKVAK